MTEQTQKKTKQDFVRLMQREFTEIESIMENVKELKDQAKEAGMDAALLAKIAKALAQNKVDDLLESSEDTIKLIEEVRS